MTGAVAIQPDVIFDPARAAEVKRLRRAARKNHFLRVSVALMLAVVAASWAFGGFDPSESLSARRLANLSRFLGDVRPRTGGGHGVATWAAELWRARGFEASLQTLALSVEMTFGSAKEASAVAKLVNEQIIALLASGQLDAVVMEMLNKVSITTKGAQLVGSGSIPDDQLMGLIGALTKPN